MRNCLILILLFAPVILSAQLTSFRVQQIENSVRIDFTIAGGNTCNGIDILHGTDSMSFEWIGDISGICGSTTDDISYSFTDIDPKVNADNFYKLDLKELGFSGVLKIHIFDDSQVTILPNPVTTVTRIHYPNGNGHSAKVELFDAAGKIVQSNEKISENPFLLEMGNMQKGVYLMKITTDKDVEFLEKIQKL